MVPCLLEQWELVRMHLLKLGTPSQASIDEAEGAFIDVVFRSSNLCGLKWMVELSTINPPQVTLAVPFLKPRKKAEKRIGHKTRTDPPMDAKLFENTDHPIDTFSASINAAPPL